MLPLFDLTPHGTVQYSAAQRVLWLRAVLLTLPLLVSLHSYHVLILEDAKKLGVLQVPALVKRSQLLLALSNLTGEAIFVLHLSA